MIRALLFALAAWAWTAGSAMAEPSRLFSDDAPLAITIDAPFAALIRAASLSTEPVAATLTVSEGGGPAQSLPVQLSARGHFRRTSGACRFPPLLLRFDKATAKATPFHHQHTLKLTTYCRPEHDYEQRIILEYLAYRLYNLMTPMSFRARAAEVTYREGGGHGAPVTRFGFLVEDIGEVAERNGRERLKGPSHAIAATQLDAHATARAALFEFLIGNLDWEFLAAPAGTDCCHNVRLLAAPGATPVTASAVVPVPYDFDYSGLVDPPYAGPPEGVPIERLTQRYYRGYCVANGEIPSVADEYKARRAAMEALISNDPRLDAGFKAKTLRFMAGFFSVLDDPARLRREIIGRCR